MVEADRADGVEPREVVGIGGVIAVPGDDIERRVVELGRPEIALKLGDDLKGFVLILECRDRGAEVARVGKAVGADRPEFGQAEERPVILADIAPRPVV